MSKDAVLSFREALNGSSEMQDKIRANPALNLVSFAAEAGFEFTADELAQVADEVGGELTDFELEVVSGGTSTTYSRTTNTVMSKETTKSGDPIGTFIGPEIC